MKKTAILMILALGLAGCGVDGNPVRPSVGVSIGPDGIKPHLGVSVRTGPVSLGIGL